MKFNIVKEGEEVTSYESDGNPTLLNPKVSVAFWDELLDGFNGIWAYAEAISKPIQLNSINVIDLDPSLNLLECDNINERNEIMKQLKEKIVMKNALMSEELENGRQIPGVSGHFEREGKFYIIVHSYLKNTDEINPELGIYKGSIVDPRKYFKGGYSINNVSNSYRDNVDEIIGNG